MEEENYNNLDEIENNQNQSLKERRGTFLTVLCILSWISSGGTFLSSISTLVNGKEGIQNQIIKAEEEIELADNGFLYDLLDASIKQLYLTLENFYGIYSTSLIISALGIYSVYLMFNLKRVGFNLYVFYALIGPLVSYYFVKDVPYSFYGTILVLVFSLAFILMYKSNLNRMTN